MLKKTVLTAGIVLAAFSVWQCSDVVVSPTSSQPSVQRELTPAEKSLVSADNAFGLKLFREILKDRQDTNVFISPLSVSMALGMTYNGADGTTREAMQQTLELNGLTLEEINQSYQSLIDLLTRLDPLVVFRIANSIWYREGYPVKADFLDRNETYFDAVVRGMDFSAPDAPATINGWVKDNTNGKIEKIVDELDPALVMMLINAIYFKGTWTYQFDPDDTEDAEFYTTPSSTVSCRMMEQEGDQAVFRNGAFTAVDLPYGDELFSMTIILPHQTTDLDSLLNEFTPESWAAWMGGFVVQETPLFMPKFKTEYELKMNDVLIALGMGVAFSGGANFNNICEYCGLYIDEVRHKTFIEVDEEGTEAAAVTSVSIYDSAPAPLRLDRPFIFAIREKASGTLIFLGRIVKPTIE
jgi:serpin B